MKESPVLLVYTGDQLSGNFHFMSLLISPLVEFGFMLLEIALLHLRYLLTWDTWPPVLLTSPLDTVSAG